MTSQTSASLDIVPFWARLNEGMIRLVDYVPDDKIDWSPKPELWNFKDILLHICIGRQNWLGNVIKDGEAASASRREAQSRDGLKVQLRVSWERLERFLSDPATMSASYEGVYYDKPTTFTADWIAYHLLEHDVHHRADLFHYLALLGIEHPNVETP